MNEHPLLVHGFWSMVIFWWLPWVPPGLHLESCLARGQRRGWCRRGRARLPPGLRAVLKDALALSLPVGGSTANFLLLLPLPPQQLELRAFPRPTGMRSSVSEPALGVSMRRCYRQHHQSLTNRWSPKRERPLLATKEGQKTAIPMLFP